MKLSKESLEKVIFNATGLKIDNKFNIVGNDANPYIITDVNIAKDKYNVLWGLIPLLTDEEYEIIETKIFTSDEIIILKNISLKYKWIARGKRGNLFLFISKPQKAEYGAWSSYCKHGNSETFITAFNHLFNSISFNDIEPTNIQEVLDNAK